MKKKILVIDESEQCRLLLSKFLTKNGYEVSSLINTDAALEHMVQEPFDVVFCNYQSKNEHNAYANLILGNAQTGIVIMADYEKVDMAGRLVEIGAHALITKPLYPELILNTLEKLADNVAKERLNEPLIATAITPNNASMDVDTHQFVNGKSEAAKSLAKQILLIAATAYSIILTGQSGTGKECIARRIHLNSNRKDKPFVAMDCGSLTKELAVSEFFGHEKGAFTGALYTKIGHFEQANGGTLFLDEIGNLSYEIQATLLRTVQERKLKRVGSTKEIDLDIRIIVATNEDLRENIKKGTFREDLFHRFNEFAIHVPTLKERGTDVFIFAEKFLQETNQELAKNLTGFSDEVKKYFLQYSWPGNIRELKNVVRRMALLTPVGEIGVKALPIELLDELNVLPIMAEEFHHHDLKNGDKSLKNAALEAEFDTILNVLKEVNFNKSKAAKLLKIDRKTLYNKIRLMSTRLD